MDATGIGELQISVIDDINVIPNPTSGDAVIMLNASENTQASVVLYDMRGIKISSIYDGQIETGENKIKFDSNRLSLVSMWSKFLMVRYLAKNDLLKYKLIRNFKNKEPSMCQSV